MPYPLSSHLSCFHRTGREEGQRDTKFKMISAQQLISQPHLSPLRQKTLSTITEWLGFCSNEILHRTASTHSPQTSPHAEARPESASNTSWGTVHPAPCAHGPEGRQPITAGQLSHESIGAMERKAPHSGHRCSPGQERSALGSRTGVRTAPHPALGQDPPSQMRVGRSPWMALPPLLHPTGTAAV